jgi:cytochrome c peroxidase
MYVFKVPSLRNVAMTPPYFHDGSVGTLRRAVQIMAKVQLGKNITESEVVEIITFLESLTRKLPADFAEAPILPAAAFEPAATASGSAR